MKSLLTIRGNLLIINLIVISLILWLAGSFLYIAIAQRQEAMLLHDSIVVEKTMSKASAALAEEQHLFLRLINSEKPATILQGNILTSAVVTTNENLDEMSGQILDLIDRSGFLDNIPATVESLQNQLTTLQNNTNQLIFQREFVLTEMSVSPEERNPNLLVGWIEAQMVLQINIANLAKSMKYLPDYNSATVEIHHTLLNEILATNIDLARKNIALGATISDGPTAASLPSFQIAMSSERIEQRLDDIVRLTETKGKAEKLHAIAVNVQTFYLQEYLLQERNFDLWDTAVDPVLIANAHAKWLKISSELTRLLSELERSTQSAVEQLAIESATKADRNLLIDIVLVVMCFFITLTSVMINRKVKRYAYHDSLTGLSNRLSFETSLKSTTSSNGQSHAVIFLDLDRFKSINDTYGHSTGDQLLVEIARRLKSLCKPSDVLARLGGDEFAVLLQNIQSSKQVMALATDMVESISHVISIQELNLKVGASAGVSIAPLDCDGGVQLLRNADIAMYHTKINNLNKVFRFIPDIAVNYKQRLTLEQDLKKGLENGEFHITYQPKVCTRTGKVKSVEALLRWIHPERGRISPAEFIPIAEDMGLMGAIGFWVIDEACREISLLKRGTLSNLQVAVNISAQQFSDENFLARVCTSIETHNLPYSSVSLEVTESIVMTDVNRVVAILKSLQDKGIDIAVDDFGTGYSSLQYLQELPLNTLKIDRAFIVALDNSDPTCSVANSIVQMASLFKLETVAEGVETLEQEAKVRALGVDHIQGYRYSNAVTSDELPATVLAIESQLETMDWANYRRAA